MLTLDIECIIKNNIHRPHIINIYDGKNVVTLAVNKKRFNKSPESESRLLFNRVFKYLFNNYKTSKENKTLITILVHNLGSYDGYFIFKALLNYLKEHKALDVLIGKENDFITIKYKNFKFIDSCRLFGGISLNELCKLFKVDSKFVSNPLWWTPDVLTNETEYLNLFEYAKQDVICLYNAIIKAITFYKDKFKIDILKSVSTASLSYKIFKKQGIHITLTSKEDRFMRKGYYGGYTNFFKFKLQKGHHYDVNSLYPFAMLNEMPYKIVGEFNKDNIPKLEDFFGFALAKIKNPTKYELLPYRKDRLYYPANGSTWTGIYFSEELKYVQSIGYEVKLIEGYHFSKYRPFDDYIKTFYDLKLEAERLGDKTLRSIAKLHLNSLYGFFGKSLYQNKILLFKKPILNSSRIIEINNKLFVNIIEEEISPKNINVALAAAVTSYARIHMYKFIHKYYEYLYYVDTDSLFLSIELPSECIGSELGLMKDELNGGLIDIAYFLGIKKYWLKLSDGRIKSVFTGIPRNSITEFEIKEIIKGNIITKYTTDNFFHDNISLNISNKNITRTVKFNPHKILIDNNYKAIRFNE